MTSFVLRLSSFVFAVALAACTGSQDLPGPARLWTVEDIQRIARNGRSLAGISASDFITLRGQTLPLLSPPFADVAQSQSAESDGLNVFPAFSEGKTAAYTTTEVWQGYPAVWLQPLYFPITGFTGGSAQILSGSRAVFTVGTRTRFYSPYWQIKYLVVPPDTAPDRFKSSKDVIDSGYPIIEGRGTLCVLAPPDVKLAQAQGANGAVRPIFGDNVKVNYAKGWVDGRGVDYIDFGKNRFTWNPDTNVVIAAALFQLGLRGDDGDLHQIGLPDVGGTGELFTNTPARVIGPRPQFGSLWHLYRAFLPGGAGVFIPSARPGLRQQIRDAAKAVQAGADNFIAPPIASANEQIPNVDRFVLRVAVNPSCFQDTAGFPGSCRWLDSQAAVEREIPGTLIKDSTLYLTCPFLAYNDQVFDPL